jgi:hypothetical protein
MRTLGLRRAVTSAAADRRTRTSSTIRAGATDFRPCATVRDAIAGRSLPDRQCVKPGGPCEAAASEGGHSSPS